MSNLFEIMTMIREQILETFSIPGLGISYWKFCIYLLIIGVVVTVLINGVRVSAGREPGLRNEAERHKRYMSRRAQSKRSRGNGGG